MGIWRKVFLTGVVLSFLPIEVSTFDCNIILQSWSEEKCSDVQGFQHFIKCMYKSNKKIYVGINNNSLTLYKCINKPKPDMRIYKCIPEKVETLEIRNCQFKKQSFISDFLQGHVVTLIIISANSKDIMPLNITFSNMPMLSKISIISIYTRGKFDIKMEELNSLSSLNIIEHDITQFPKMPFKNLEKLRNLAIRDGSLSSLTNDLFVGLYNLNILDLSRNKITNIENSTFQHLSQLYMLELSDNKISAIYVYSFAFLKKLNTLRLSRNELTHVPEHFFVDLPALGDLDISGNPKIKEFPDRFFRGVRKLKRFSASHCSLNTISHTLFLGISPRNNDTQSATLMKKFIVRKSVTNVLQFNSAKRLAHLDKNGFIELKLSGETVKQPSNTVNENIWQYFTSLYMSYNQLSIIHEATFDPLVSLEILFLSYNPLHTLPQNMPFGRSKKLSEVVINSCKLTEFPKIDWTKHNLEHLDLSSNAIKQVHLPLFISTKTIIILAYNKISMIRINYSRHWESSPFYYLGGNNPNCDCNMEPFLRYLHFDKTKSTPVFEDANKVKCKQSQISEPLSDVWPEHISCPIMDCPNKCKCTTIEQKKTHVDCSRLNLIQIPNAIPYMTATVNLDENMIPGIYFENTKDWQGVVNISLKNNILQTIEDGTIPVSVRRLELSNNRLKSIPSALMLRVSSTTNFGIFLADNPWICNCESLQFIKWWKENYYKIFDHERAYCNIVTPENDNIKQVLITSISTDDVCSSYVTRRLTKMYLLYPVCLLLAIVCLAFLIHKFKHSILALMYVYDVYPSLLDRNMVYVKKKFDAFVCYTAQDAKVYKNIHRKMKREFRFYSNKLTETRRLKQGQIFPTMKRSRFIVLLISERFIHRFMLYKLGTTFLQLTHMHFRFVIPVFTEKISNTKALPVTVQMILFSEYKLWWKEALFWMKLRYFLRVPSNRSHAPSTRKK